MTSIFKTSIYNLLICQLSAKGNKLTQSNINILIINSFMKTLLIIFERKQIYKQFGNNLLIVIFELVIKGIHSLSYSQNK